MTVIDRMRSAAARTSSIDYDPQQPVRPQLRNRRATRNGQRPPRLRLKPIGLIARFNQPAPVRGEEIGFPKIAAIQSVQAGLRAREAIECLAHLGRLAGWLEVAGENN